MDSTQLIIKIVIGCLIIIVGGSFAYKAYRAAVVGKMTYWTGFLPFSVVSPFLVHVPAKKDTLIKDISGLWVHLLMGPIFFLIAILAFAMGSDIMGLPGTDTLNLILSGGNPLAPRAIVYNKNYGFSFPILTRASHKVGKSMNKVIIPLNEKDKFYGYEEGKNVGQQ